ncbi:MAG: radical SAM protein [Acidaminobacteraceae bacterium]
MKMPVHRIIPFSNVEGSGNRTSIFTQGCNANCLYCHNSETIPMKSDETKLYSVDDLLEVIKANMPFIRGITVSGGEATIHHKFLTELFKKVRELGLTCYVDTNGFFDIEEISDLIEVTDKFLFDIKGVGESLENLCFSDFLHVASKLVDNHKEDFSKSNKHLETLKFLLSQDKIEEVRLVYVKSFYDEKMAVGMIAEELVKYPEVLFKLIRVHARGLEVERAIKLKGTIPTELETDALAKYATNLGLNNIKVIY